MPIGNLPRGFFNVLQLSVQLAVFEKHLILFVDKVQILQTSLGLFYSLRKGIVQMIFGVKEVILLYFLVGVSMVGVKS